MSKPKRNKFYGVTDGFDDTRCVNIVIASNIKEAKKLGVGHGATQDVRSWTDIRVTAVKGGQGFYKEEKGSAIIWVGGEGFIYTEEEAQNDYFMDLLFKELKAQDRYIEEEPDDY